MNKKFRYLIRSTLLFNFFYHIQLVNHFKRNVKTDKEPFTWRTDKKDIILFTFFRPALYRLQLFPDKSYLKML